MAPRKNFTAFLRWGPNFHFGFASRLITTRFTTQLSGIDQNRAVRTGTANLVSPNVFEPKCETRVRSGTAFPEFGDRCSTN
jgi:hypothetical protein